MFIRLHKARRAIRPSPFVTQWLNPAAFAAPALGTFGNVGQYAVFGPGFWEWDQAISRQFTIHERQRMEVRFEAFNVTNQLSAGQSRNEHSRRQYVSA